MRNVTVLIKDAMMADDYKLKVNLLIAGLMGEELDVDQEKDDNRRHMLKEISYYCDNANESGEKSDYLKRTSERIKRYLG
ncbi:MAG: hypothetical protein HP023_15065 [Lachnospiraceae bacterium]|nr:hypothetical protein [Lachnospiraceae bacterium]